jgi:hypothetical protein
MNVYGNFNTDSGGDITHNFFKKFNFKNDFYENLFEIASS